MMQLFFKHFELDTTFDLLFHHIYTSLNLFKSDSNNFLATLNLLLHHI